MGELIDMAQIATLLDLVAAKARELRSAGVRQLELPNLIRIELDAPDAGPLVEARGVVEMNVAGDEDLSDPLNDPATFGRRDGKLPGFQLRKREAE